MSKGNTGAKFIKKFKNRQNPGA